MNKKLFWLLLILITIFGFYLRWRRLAEVPLPGQSQDEYSNAWVGLSLIQTGMPVGLSGVGGNLNSQRIYVNPDRVFQKTAAGDAMTIGYPWFDHPPLVPLITGGFAYFKGARVFEDVSAVTLRKPVAGLSILIIGLTGLLAMELFGPAAGLLAALFYAAAPLTTIMNRMVQAENFMMAAVLFSFYCLFRFSLNKKKIWWYLAAAGLAACVLTKISGFAFVIAAMALLKTSSKQKWPWLGLGALALAAFSWWVMFGLALSPESFFDVLLSNSQRAYGIGYQAVADLLTTVKVTGTKTITDGWVLASFLGFIALAVSGAKNKNWVTVPVLTYLAVYLFFGSQSYGWYRLPFFPFTFMALGFLAVELFKKAELAGLLLFLIPLGVSAAKVIPVDGIWLTGFRLLPLIVITGGYFLRNEKINRLVLVFLMVLAVVISLIYNLKIDISFWYQLS